MDEDAKQVIAVTSSDLGQIDRIEPVLSGSFQRAETANEEDRTVEIVFSTGARVRRRGMLPDGSGYGSFEEELDMSPGAVDLSRMNEGKSPILDTHDRYSVSGQLGTVVSGSAKIENGQGVCVAKFRDTESALEIFRSIADGTVGNVSVGYNVLAYQVTRNDGEVPVFRATKWRPFEVSIVPVGADPKAGVRSAPDNPSPCEFTYFGDREMENEKGRARAGSEGNGEDTRADTGNPDGKKGAGQEDHSRSADPNQLVLEERARARDIRDAVRILPAEESVRFADELIEAGVPVDAARARIIDRAAELSESVNIRGVRVDGGESGDDPEVMAARMAEATACRYTGQEPGEAAREYVGMSMSAMASCLLEARGVGVRRMRGPEVIERALGTSDFPNLLQATGDRLLLPSYMETPSTYQLIARRVTNRDFRAKALLRDGDFPELKPLNEHGELTEGSMSESKETITLATVGRRIRLTRQMLINDDLSAFADLATKAGQAARRYENSTVWGVVTANKKLASDNKALFHDDHGNLAGSGAAISAASVGAGKSAIRVQKSKDGSPLNYAPSLIAVPSAKETVLEQYLAAMVYPTSQSEVIPASHKQLTPVVEPLLDDDSATAWYLFTNPGSLAAVVYAYLEGQEGPQMLQHEVTLTGMSFDVALDFAAAPVEYRAAYKDPGA